MRCPDKAGRHEPYESRGSRADLWEPEAAMPPATRQSTRVSCEKKARKKYVVNTNAKGKKHAGGKKHG